MYGEVVVDETGRCCPGCTRRASAPASRCMAPTGWAPTRWSTWSSSAGDAGKRHGRILPRRPSSRPLPADPEARSPPQLERIRKSDGAGEGRRASRNEMQQVMMDNVGVFRTEHGMQQALDKVQRTAGALPAHLRVDDKGKMLQHRSAGSVGAGLPAGPGRGHGRVRRWPARRAGAAHAREDFPKRDDVNWLKHTPGHAGRTAGCRLRLQAGDVITKFAAQGTGRIEREKLDEGNAENPPLQPGSDRSPTGRPTSWRRSRPTACWTCCNQVKWYQDGTLALPPLVRARHLRLGRDAHQRAQRAGLQGAGQGRGQPADHRRAAAGPAGDQRPDRGHGAVLRALPLGDALPGQRRAGARDGSACRARSSEPLRRHHQVHPVRRLHHLLPVVLGQRRVRRPGGHRAGAPLHLRQPRPGWRGAAGRC